LFIVKKLNRNAKWDTISLYDENGSFRGEAKFESKDETLEYIEKYKQRTNERLKAKGKSKTKLKLQVFEMDDKSIIEEKKRKYGWSYYHNINPPS
jgi:hypothetical protein